MGNMNIIGLKALKVHHSKTYPLASKVRYHNFPRHTVLNNISSWKLLVHCWKFPLNLFNRKPIVIMLQFIWLQSQTSAVQKMKMGKKMQQVGLEPKMKSEQNLKKIDNFCNFIYEKDIHFNHNHYVVQIPVTALWENMSFSFPCRTGHTGQFFCRTWFFSGIGSINTTCGICILRLCMK